jgi:cytidylate kinase
MPRLQLEKYINAQFQFWRSQRDSIKTADPQDNAVSPFITLSREYGCFGLNTAGSLAKLLNKVNNDEKWAVFDREVLDKVMSDYGLSECLAKTLTDYARGQLTNVISTTFSKFPSQLAVYMKLAETVRMLAVNGNVIILGRAGSVITRGMNGGYHVRIIASMDHKIKNVMGSKGISRKEAEALIIENNRRRYDYIKEYVNFDMEDPHNYDLIVNITKCSDDGAAGIINEGMKASGLFKRTE